jgi:hypothetical protein
MSISDYLKYKRVTTELKQLAKYPPVLSVSDYTDFKEFTIEKQMAYVNNTQGYTSPVNSNGSIFGMSLKTTGCASFPLCSQTQSRVNRVPMATIYSDSSPVPVYQKVYPLPNYVPNCDDATNTYFNAVDSKTGRLCSLFANTRYFNSNNMTKKQVYANMQGLPNLIR